MLSICQPGPQGSCILPSADDPPFFNAVQFDRLLKMVLYPWVFATGDERGLTAELPFHGNRPAILTAIKKDVGAGENETALLLVSGQERHPHIGNGASLRLTLPSRFEKEEAIEVTQQLNL